GGMRKAAILSVRKGLEKLPDKERCEIEGDRRVLALGGKDSPLSSTSVFEFVIASPP
ncbi:hypothetical protein Tco_1366935, partial [Tanacetum coccineum]